MGDTLKPLYYSPFLLFTCFLFANYFEKNNKNKIIFIFFIPLVFVILGFPKSIDEEFARDVVQINNYSFFCEFNKKNFQKLTKESTCVEGPIVRQLEYEFMNIQSYNDRPRFKPLNTMLIVTNIISLLILIFNKSSKKTFAVNSYKKHE